MRYAFLIDTYETERLKVLSVWSMFADEDLAFRPHPTDPRGRSVHEQMVHQCVSEENWFRGLLGIDVGARPLPAAETRLGFLQQYAQDSARRLRALREQGDDWWEEVRPFFEVARPRTWILVRRLAHTAHHRGQQTALLRMLGRSLHSTYGPTADTGGLPAQKAPTVYAYEDADALLQGEAAGGAKAALPGPGSASPTERPQA
ncbi:MAG TPA: DinB family protein [Vicinamibacteria bacterium]